MLGIEPQQIFFLQQPYQVQFQIKLIILIILILRHSGKIKQGIFKACVQFTLVTMCSRTLNSFCYLMKKSFGENVLYIPKIRSRKCMFLMVLKRTSH